MDIIATTVCVNYHDILKHMLPNSKFFSKWYIVTSPEDKNTTALIKDSRLKNIEILLYPDFYKKAKFNKGGAVRFAQKYIEKEHKSCNLLLLDADICLPDNFTSKLPDKLELDTLYGVSGRFDYWTLDDYKNKKNPHSYLHGHNCVGFFQLYKESSKYIYKNSQNCSKCDSEFIKLFKKKVNLKLSVSHLGKDEINWNGRINVLEYR
jgi:hypothetical protein